MKLPKSWNLIITGGNCTAWQHPFQYAGATPDSYALLTQAGSPEAPTRERQLVTLSIYGVCDRQILSIECPSVADAIAIVKSISFIEEFEIQGY